MAKLELVFATSTYGPIVLTYDSHATFDLRREDGVPTRMRLRLRGVS